MSTGGCFTCYLIGKNVEKLRKSSRPKKGFYCEIAGFGAGHQPDELLELEGQLRNATDKEVYAIARVLGIPLETLFGAR